VAIGRDRAILRQLRTLFDSGTVGGLTDGQLLERFARRPAEVAEAAFAALVERHGPMVLRVCRGVLVDPHEAEDAFQATFLVLVRKARALWVRDSLGPWLHQVAYRTASCARSDAARRRRHERRAAETRRANPADDRVGIVEEWEPMLHEEIDRLPERYRAAVVLCSLEGLTHEQAAQQLGWPVGTVKSRLARGRERLRGRLTRRGLAPALGTLSAGSSHNDGAAIPAALARSTVRTLMTADAGHAATGAISATVTALSEGVLTTMSLTKYKIAATVLLALGVGAGALAYQPLNGLRGKPSKEGGKAPAGATPNPALPPRPPDTPRDLEAKTKALKEELDKPIVLTIPNETTLGAALKSIRKATADADGPGIPIYIDPAGLQEAGAAMDKPIHVSFFEGKTPLRENFRQLLRPLGMDYWVNDGLVSISSRDKVLDQNIWRLTDKLREVTERLEAVERRAAKGDGNGPGPREPE